MSRIKGSHAVIKTGALVAEAAFAAMKEQRQRDELASYPAAFEQSWLHEELHVARNVNPWLAKRLYLGSIMTASTRSSCAARPHRPCTATTATTSA